MVQPEVTIQQGTLRGSLAKDIRGDTFFKFQGIPYAKPPLGKLRFKAPQPPEPWTGILDASKEGESSYQKDPLKNGAIYGSENCLFLNVYTKKLPKDEDQTLRPVMFWVHGGGFFFGSGNEDFYGPDFLIPEDVVIVTINYRLGILGFVSFKDPSLEVPGNAGLKDQVMALKWVQKNISKFGGDPNNVTIFGESAGGAAIHLLVLSPTTRGLFHKAIAQSGCAFNPWARGTRGVEFLAAAVGLEGADERTVYNALMKKSVEEILQIQEKIFKEFLPNERRTVGFVVEESSPEAFLPDEPITLISTGRFNQVPFMVGYTTAEGMCFDIFPRDIKDFKYEIPWYFGYDPSAPETQIVADKVKRFYFGDDNVSPRPINKKYDLLSDVQFVHGLYLTVVSQFGISKAPTYLYRVSIETELNLLKKLLKIEVPGTSHLDDVGYLFKNSATPEITPGSVEDAGLRKFVKLWTNFAKYGNPTPDPLLKVIWKPVTSKSLDFLDIGKELVAGINPDTERINFWQELFKKSPAGQKVKSLFV